MKTISNPNTVTQNAGDFLNASLKRYGEEVNYNRSLPRLEDGLKPVQRFLLWSSLDLGGDKFVKSAKITGHCIASYSPHSDAATYGSMVNMVGERFPYMEGQGNFGGPTTEAAAPRYTEARIHPMYRKMMTDLADMNVVPYEENYDDTKKQPVYLPCVLPNVLLNSCLGIGYGIKTSMPGFNVLEISDAVVTYLKTNDMEKALKKVLAPDSSDCKILPESEIEALIKTGVGSVTWECKHHIEQMKKRKAVVVTGFAPDFEVKGLLSKLAKLKEDDLIWTVRNETSAKNGDRIVIEYDDESIVPKVLKMLRKKVSYRMVVLVDVAGNLEAKTLGVGDIIAEWIKVRKELVTKTLAEQIKAATEKKSKESLKMRVVTDLKKLIKCLEAVDTEAEICKQFSMTSDEAKMILDMRLESLKNSDIEKLKKKIADLDTDLATLNADISDPAKVIIDQVTDFVKFMKKEFPENCGRKSVLVQ